MGEGDEGPAESGLVLVEVDVVVSVSGMSGCLVGQLAPTANNVGTQRVYTAQVPELSKLGECIYLHTRAIEKTNKEKTKPETVL